MELAVLIFLQLWIAHAVDLFDDSPSFPDHDIRDSILEEHLLIRTPKERKFLEGLIVEAGRHVLFPEMYTSMEEHPETNFDGGQPEVVETYMERSGRSEKSGLGCPEECPLYKPVCGSDGKVYESECHMRRENCGLASVTAGSWHKCRGKHYLCPTNCLNINDPVCGSDGIIYRNICIMRKRNCGKLLEKRPLRSCYTGSKELKNTEICPEECQGLYKPVCGSDGVIYYNECFMRLRACRQGVVEVDMEGCATTSKCPEVCLPLYDPVCGSDGRLYINQCRMMQQNCGKEIKRMPKSFCNFDPKGVRRPSKSS